MARFSAEQAAAVAAIQQVINEWGDQLDTNNGLTMVEADVLTEDCRYFVGEQWREGLAATAQFYRDRWDKLQASNSVLVMRHLISNYRITFTAEDQASVSFLLVFYAKAGEGPFTDYCDPLAVADVRMECRRGADGHWRISMFDSGQIFQRG